MRVVPAMLLNTPLTKILPSGWRARALTPLFALGSKEESRLPSAFSRAMLLRVVPLMEVKYPPTTILPSGWMAKLVA